MNKKIILLGIIFGILLIGNANAVSLDVEPKTLNATFYLYERTSNNLTQTAEFLIKIKNTDNVTFEYIDFVSENNWTVDTNPKNMMIPPFTNGTYEFHIKVTVGNLSEYENKTINDTIKIMGNYSQTINNTTTKIRDVLFEMPLNINVISYLEPEMEYFFRMCHYENDVEVCEKLNYSSLQELFNLTINRVENVTIVNESNKYLIETSAFAKYSEKIIDEIRLLSKEIKKWRDSDQQLISKSLLNITDDIKTIAGIKKNATKNAELIMNVLNGAEDNEIWFMVSHSINGQPENPMSVNDIIRKTGLTIEEYNEAMALLRSQNKIVDKKNIYTTGKGIETKQHIEDYVASRIRKENLDRIKETESFASTIMAILGVVIIIGGIIIVVKKFTLEASHTEM